MNKITSLTILIYLLMALCFSVSNVVFALEEKNTLVSVITEPERGYWVFSGLVKNDNGELFGYYFQMKREEKTFQVQTAVLNDVTGKLLFHYEAKEIINNPVDFNWKIGHAFLHFNPINESWVFGVKKPDKSGFNFKVDVLTQPSVKKETQVLTEGMEALFHQTGHVDGLLQVNSGTKEQFVTASNAWFAKTWINKEPVNQHRLNTGLCRFYDGSGFYSGNLQDTEKRLASFGSFKDSEGKVVKMSQFMEIDSANNNLWKIHLTLPKLAFDLKNSLVELNPEKPMAAGFFQEGSKGFCFFSQLDFTEKGVG